MLRLLILSLLMLLGLRSAFAEDSFKLGGFLDTYYAYDFNDPHDHKRDYTTQPARHEEARVNLAYLEAVLKKKKIRGRTALQYGTSVDRNYQSEANQDLKVIQEAYLGVRLGERTWLDGGVFLGNIGAESWISKDNWTYSRALMLDYVPYYSAGLRLGHDIDAKSSFQLQLLNGWQNISENNGGKAVGGQYKRRVTERFTFTYNNFFGDEEVVSKRPRFRSYHDFIFQYSFSESWQYLWSFDIGHQSQQKKKGVDLWYAIAFTVRKILNPSQSMAARFEYYHDPHEANVVTRTRNGFQVAGASVNFDQKFGTHLTWRSELRGLSSRDRIFPKSKEKTFIDGFAVTSLSIIF